MTDIRPGRWYYKTDLQKTTLEEMLHFLPGWKGILKWLFKTLGFVRLPVLSGFAPMPIRAATFLGPSEKLSARALSFIEPLAESFERLEFERLGYESQEGFLSDEFPDGGGCHFRHRNGLWVASVIYSHSLIGDFREIVQLTIWGLRSDGRPYRALNLPPAQVVDPFSQRILNAQVFQLDTTSPTELFQFFEKKVAEGPGKSSFRHFAGKDDFLRCMEDLSVRVLEAGLREGRFIPMTEAEVAALREKHGKKETYA